MQFDSCKSRKKSEIIHYHINKKLRKEYEENIPRLVKKYKLDMKQKELKRLQKKVDEYRNKFDKELDKLNLYWSSYRNEKKWTIDNHRANFVPANEIAMLATAQRLMDLGKKAGANKIYDKLIKKYELEE